MGRELYVLHRPSVPSPFAALELANGCFERITFHQGNLRVAGWMLLPDQPFNSFQLWIDGLFLGTADKVMRLDLADVHPWLSHARDSGFRFSVPLAIPEQTTVRIDVLGCQGTNPLARLSTWFTLDIKQAVPTPPPQLMKRVVGMDDAHLFKLTGLKCCGELVDALDRHRKPKEVQRLLDWGCGCGRVTAHLMNLVDAPAVSGCDIDAEAIAWCNEHLGRGQFAAIDPWPPTAYEDGAFDVVFGCSVFTHLTHDAQKAWLAEMQRILAPGGLLLTTVLGPFVIRFSFPDHYPQILQKGFVDASADTSLDGIAPPGYYRAVYQSREYTFREWSKYFDILEYIDRGIGNFHDLVVMRRPAAHVNLRDRLITSESKRRGPGMNVCLVSQEYPPDTAWGGIGTQTKVKAQALARLGHTVHVLTRSAGADADTRIEKEGSITVHRMQPPGFDFPIFARQTYMMGYTWHVLRALCRLREQFDLDVLDFPEYGGEGFAYLMDRTSWNWLPVVIHIHGPLAMFTDHMGWPQLGSRFHLFGTFMEELSVKRADALMAGSSAIADIVCHHYKVQRSSIDIVHCGVDADAFHPAKEKPRQSERLTVLFVGQLVETKGMDATFDAVLQLRRKYPNIRLQILGKFRDSDLFHRMQREVEAQRAEENIEFVGFVPPDQLLEYYQQADVFCSPAWFEGGTASVYLEAMASGCPVVASTAGGAPEAINDGEQGFLVPPNDVAATRDALDRILGDPFLRARMGQAARQRVEDYFSIEKHGRRIEAVYANAIARSQQSEERSIDNRE